MGVSTILKMSRLYEKGLLGTRVGCLMILHQVKLLDGDSLEIFNMDH